MHPALRKMPPLAAAATDSRLRCEESTVRQDAATGHTCSVRLHGTLVPTYMVRAVGGFRPRVVCSDPPRRFDHKFYLYDPDTFFRGHVACSATIHQMLAQTPVVGDFDLADHNWDHNVLPHALASMSIVGGFPGAATDTGVVHRRRNIDIRLTLRVTAVYSEPRALLRACQQATVARRRLVAAAGLVVHTGIMAATGECSVCMEDLLAPKDSSDDDTVMLPCSHVFHTSCLLPWFHKESTCPMCRREMIRFLVAVTRTPKGRFPGLEA